MDDRVTNIAVGISLALVTVVSLGSCNRSGAPPERRNPGGGTRAAAKVLSAALEAKKEQEERELKNDAGRITAEIICQMDATSRLLEQCRLTTQLLDEMEGQGKPDLLRAAATYSLGIATGELRADYEQAATMLDLLRARSKELRACRTRGRFLGGSVGMQQIGRDSLRATAEHQSPEMQAMLIAAEVNEYRATLAECMVLMASREQDSGAPSSRPE
ncbi:MAG: hypothetical protein AAF481_07865 [Acidobacteriota bacterium]